MDLTDFAKSGFVCGLIIIYEKSLQVTIQGENSVIWRF